MRMRCGGCDMAIVIPLGVRISCRRRNTSPYRITLWYMIMPHALRSYLIMYYHYRIHSRLTRPLSLATSRIEVASVCPPPRIVCFLSKCIWMRESRSRIRICRIDVQRLREDKMWKEDIWCRKKINIYKNLIRDNKTKFIFLSSWTQSFERAW